MEKDGEEEKKRGEKGKMSKGCAGGSRRGAGTLQNILFHPDLICRPFGGRRGEGGGVVGRGWITYAYTMTPQTMEGHHHYL